MKEKKKKEIDKKTMFDRFNLYLTRKHRVVFGFILVLATLFAILLFDVKINMMGDDAEYLLYGYNFAHNFDFPGYRGPLYPILLSPFIAVFGINIVLLKVLSVVMILASLFFLYRAFYGRIPSLILFSCLFLFAINSFFMFYASAILSEPLFFLLQSILIFFFCRYFVDEVETPLNKRQIPHFFIIAFVTLCLTLTRTVGYAAIGIFVVYFLFFKQWKKALLSAGANAIVFGLFGLVKKILWPSSGNAYPLSSFFTIDMYNPDRGMEDFGGIVVRLLTNINNYLSIYVMRFTGLKSTISVSAFIALIIVLLFCWGGYIAYRKNKPLFFTALYTLGFCTANFIILHATWLQERFIIVYFPLILLIIFVGIYYFLQEKKGFHFILIAVTIVLFISSFNQTLTKVKDNSKSLKMALRGNILYGLTPDWQNYIEMSKWAAKNVPASENIAVRKPGTSTIYANRNFYGVYTVPSISKDTLNTWKPEGSKIFLAVNISPKPPLKLSEFLVFAASGDVNIQGEKAHSTAIYAINAADTSWITTLLNEEKIKYTFDFEEYKTSFLKIPDNLLYSPEKLFNALKNANVKYMILASLRINANENTGSIVNTLHRYVNILSLKYPYMIFEKIKIGTVEPAVLMELRY
ncbi:MAG: hypothetical protein LBT50_03500 [Prevotellaceae bacterium]|nr:hypothetical protein [Prevotellaceae bacterium]